MVTPPSGDTAGATGTVTPTDQVEQPGAVRATGTVRRAERRPWPPSWVPPLAVYAAVLAVLLAVSWQVVDRFAEDPRGVPPVEFRGEWFWDGWVRYDGGWYTIIADQGYSLVPGRQSTVAFFPGYPMLVRAAGAVTGNTPLGGIAVTLACGAAALVAYHRWCRRRLGPAAALTAVLCLALYPYAYYLYGAVYAEALFLLCALVAFLAFERDHLLVAGLAGAAAGATRLVGVAVAIALVVGVAERRGVVAGTGGRWRDRLDLSRLRPRDGWVLLAFGGLAGWVGFLWRRFDDPLVFTSMQSAWGQEPGPGTWFKRDFLAAVWGGDNRLYALGLVVQALVTVLVVASVPRVARRFGWRYGAYVAVVAAIPVAGSQDFHAMGRYLLVAFPSFAVLGEALARRPAARRVVLPAAAVALVVLTAGFAHGRYVA